MLVGSVYLSLGLQIATVHIDAIALRLKVQPRAEILRDLLKMELFVQIVESIFYTWLAVNITNVENITPKRYFDWFITTPTMLITFTVLIMHLNRKGNMEGETLLGILSRHKKEFTIIIILNAVMLAFGLAGEYNLVDNTYAVILGFLPFVAYYFFIYKDFVQDKTTGETNPMAKRLFYFFFITWGLYGVLALMPYATKNIGYNFLDLISKNLFGLILSYMVFINQ